ncbi:MAG: histidinol-phosphatase [Magnetospirillum sp. WYHS-4]
MSEPTGRDLDVFAALAIRLADAARPIARKYFRGAFAVDDKADSSPVTIADREIEAALRALIEQAFPDHGIFGEEHGRTRMEADYIWVIDPIDGTQGFVTGKPLFGSLIALTYKGRPVVGVIETPATGERWVGVKGRPTLFDGREVRVRACADLARGWLYATTPHMFAGAEAEAFDRLRGRVKKSLYGADCYAYGLLANGTVDLVCEASLKPYDYCALVPVVEGAGGVISDWEGRPLTVASGSRVLAAGDAAAHRAALTALAGESG